MNLLRSAVRGGVALGVSQTVATVVGSVRILILARLLVPGDFGLVGLCSVLIGFLGSISNLGLTAATIQRKDLEDGHCDAAFWMSVAMGATLFIICLAVAPIFALFYDEPRLRLIVIVSAIPLLLGPFSSTHSALLQRELRFGRLAWIEATRNIVASVATIGLAAAGLGYWSIPLGPIASHLIAIPAYTLSSSLRPGFRATWRHARELFSFSVYVAGGTAINFLSANLDYAIVGKKLGTAVLGTYTYAYELMTFPLLRIASLFGQVMFPAFAKIQDDLEQMRDVFVKSSRSIALVSFPILAWVAVVAPELLGLLYGPKWLPAVEPLRALSVAGACKCVGTLVGAVYNTRGKSRVGFYWNIAWLVMLTPGLLIGVRFGAFGVGVAISVLSVLGTLFTEWLACRYLEMPFGRLLRSLIAPAASVSIAIVAGAFARAPLTAGLPPGFIGDALRLVALTFLMLLVYGGFLRLLYPELLADIREFLGHFRREKPPAAKPTTERDQARVSDAVKESS